MDVKDLLRPGDGDGDDRARPDFEERQTKTYAGATAQSIPQAAVADLRNFLRDSAPPKSYDAHANVRFLYEIMCKPGWEDEVKKVVLPWIEDASNIQRAARQVTRSADDTRSNLLRGFCVFRLKASEDVGWTTSSDTLGIDRHEPQTVVFIALQDLNANNGFFMSLPQGCDVCLDSRAEVLFPSGGGGGMGIFLALNL